MTAARQLASLCRPAPGVDTKVFMTAWVTIMMEYPLDIVYQVADPAKGLPSKSPWMPSPFDVRKALDEAMAPRLEARAKAKRIEQQFADRELLVVERQSLRDIEDEMASRGVYMSGWLARNGRKMRRLDDGRGDNWKRIGEVAGAAELASSGDLPIDPATGKHPAGTILSNFDEAFRLYGRPIGVFEEGREHPYDTKRQRGA